MEALAPQDISEGVAACLVADTAKYGVVLKRNGQRVRVDLSPSGGRVQWVMASELLCERATPTPTSGGVATAEPDVEPGAPPSAPTHGLGAQPEPTPQLELGTGAEPEPQTDDEIQKDASASKSQQLLSLQPEPEPEPEPEMQLEMEPQRRPQPQPQPSHGAVDVTQKRTVSWGAPDVRSVPGRSDPSAQSHGPLSTGATDEGDRSGENVDFMAVLMAQGLSPQRFDLTPSPRAPLLAPAVPPSSPSAAAAAGAAEEEEDPTCMLLHVRAVGGALGGALEHEPTLVKQFGQFSEPQRQADESTGGAGLERKKKKKKKKAPAPGTALAPVEPGKKKKPKKPAGATWEDMSKRSFSPAKQKQTRSPQLTPQPAPALHVAASAPKPALLTEEIVQPHLLLPETPPTEIDAAPAVTHLPPPIPSSAPPVVPAAQLGDEDAVVAPGHETAAPTANAAAMGRNCSNTGGKRRYDTLTVTALEGACEEFVATLDSALPSVALELRLWRDELAAPAAASADLPYTIQRLEQPRCIMERLKNELIEREQEALLQIIRESPSWDAGVAGAVRRSGNLWFQSETDEDGDSDDLRNEMLCLSRRVGCFARPDFRQRWKRRYFVLTAAWFEFYREMEDEFGHGKKLERVCRRRVSTIKTVANAGGAREGGEARGLLSSVDSMLQLRITDDDGFLQTWCLTAESPASAAEWLAQIQQACTEATVETSELQAGLRQYSKEQGLVKYEIVSRLDDILAFATDHQLLDATKHSPAAVFAQFQAHHTMARGSDGGGMAAMTDQEREQAEDELGQAFTVLRSTVDCFVEREVLQPKALALQMVMRCCETQAAAAAVALSDKIDRLVSVPQSSAIFDIRPKFQSPSDWGAAVQALQQLDALTVEAADWLLPSEAADIILAMLRALPAAGRWLRRRQLARVPQLYSCRRVLYPIYSTMCTVRVGKVVQ
jgi:hypothetical protein